MRCWERASSYAWFASVASCIALDDPHFDKGRAFFGRSAEVAYEYAMDALGGPSERKVSGGELVPVGESDVLTRSNFYKELFREREEARWSLRLHKELGEAVSESRQRLFW